MDADLRVLEALSKGLRELEGSVSGKIALAAKDEVLAEARATVIAGESPDGKAWAPKKGGGRALPDAASALSIVVSGATEAVLTLVLKGAYVFHNAARGKHPPRRQILFGAADGVPPRIAAIIKKHAQRVVTAAIGGPR